MAHNTISGERVYRAVHIFLLIFLFIVTTAASKQTTPDMVDALIKKLQSTHAGARAKAAAGLGRIKDARAVPPLIGLLKDADSYVRGQAAEALGDIGDKRAAQPLITLMKDDDYMYVRQEAAKALGKIRDGSAVQPLINALNDESPDVREEATEALINIGVPANERLNKALKEGNYKVVADAYYFFISVGTAGSEPALIKALHRYGNKRMAMDFMNCENKELEQAAYKWAQNHGYNAGELKGSADSPKWKRFAD